MSENNLPFIKRFYKYQKERFPFLAHGLMIAAFTFSAISYSIMCRGQKTFIPKTDFILGVFITITFFFLVRIFDEFKDHQDDVKNRPYLPVPRGLISLKELKVIGIIVALLQLGVILVFQIEMIGLYGLVMLYLLFMSVEFFVPTWLKKKPIIYVTSHMFIIPLIDMYASGLDWLLNGSWPHYGLIWFFVVSYFNGLVLELGRKMRTNENEEEGVVSYTSLFGIKGGPIVWLVMLVVTVALAIGATVYAQLGNESIYLLISFFILLSVPGWLFLWNPSTKKAKWMEYSSALWTALMYLCLGGIPMLKSLIF